jgi:hypothetical protein
MTVRMLVSDALSRQPFVLQLLLEDFNHEVVGLLRIYTGWIGELRRVPGEDGRRGLAETAAQT